MKKILSIYTLCTLLVTTSIYADCSITQVPTTGVRAFEENVETIITAVKKIADTTVCAREDTTDTNRINYLNVVVPAQTIRAVLNNIQSVGFDAKKMSSELSFYTEGENMKLPAVQKHEEYIGKIEDKILAAGVYIGGRCAHGMRMTEDVVLKDSGYKTSGRTLQEILADLYKQTNQVTIFYRNIVQGINDQDYLDEGNFSLAPVGFSLGMRQTFTADALQACHDADPKTVAIKDVMKKSFVNSWKFPQATRVWKEAFQLLLYRGKQLTGSGAKDAAKEAEINRIVQAQKGGVGNSTFLINSQFFKEFGHRPNNQSALEMMKIAAQKIAYETFGNIFRKNTLPEVIEANKGQGGAPAVEFSDQNQTGISLATLDRNLYNAYAKNNLTVQEDKAADPLMVEPLVQTLEELDKARATIEENTNLACSSLSKQATNISKWKCPGQ